MKPEIRTNQTAGPTPAPARTAAPSAPEPTAPAYAADQAVLRNNAPKKTAANDGQFSWGQAGQSWLKGFINAPITMWQGIKARPLLTLGMLAGTVGVVALAPVALGAVGISVSAATIGSAIGIGFGAWGGFTMVRGGVTAAAAAKRGDGDGAEKAFEAIGRGSFDAATAVVPWAAGKAVQAVRGGQAAKAVARVAHADDTLAATKPHTVPPKAPITRKAGSALLTQPKQMPLAAAPGAVKGMSGRSVMELVYNETHKQGATTQDIGRWMAEVFGSEATSVPGKLPPIQTAQGPVVLSAAQQTKLRYAFHESLASSNNLTGLTDGIASVTRFRLSAMMRESAKTGEQVRALEESLAAATAVLEKTPPQLFYADRSLVAGRLSATGLPPAAVEAAIARMRTSLDLVDVPAFRTLAGLKPPTVQSVDRVWLLDRLRAQIGSGAEPGALEELTEQILHHGPAARRFPNHKGVQGGHIHSMDKAQIQWAIGEQVAAKNGFQGLVSREAIESIVLSDEVIQANFGMSLSAKEIASAIELAEKTPAHFWITEPGLATNQSMYRIAAEPPLPEVMAAVQRGMAKALRQVDHQALQTLLKAQ